MTRITLLIFSYLTLFSLGMHSDAQAQSDFAGKSVPLSRLTILVQATGVYPQQIELNPGRYLLDIKKAGIIGPIPVRLTRDNGETRADKVVATKSQRDLSTVELSEGRYILRTLPGEAFECRLVVSSAVNQARNQGSKSNE
jgi:hypothetical protein